MKYGILLLAIGAPFGADAQSIASFVEERSFQPDLMPSPPGSVSPACQDDRSSQQGKALGRLL